MEIGYRPKIPEIENGPEVNKERFSALTREDDATMSEPVHRGARETGIVRCRERTDIARWAAKVLGEHSSTVAIDSGDRIELSAIPILAVEGFNRADVVEERVRVRGLAVELELIGHVRGAIPRVVDVQLIEDVVA